MVEVKVKAPKVSREITVTAEIPDSLNGLVEAYGEEAVASAASGSIKIALQGYVRSMLEANATDEKILDAVATWKPGTKKDSVTSLIGKVATMSDDEKAALMAALGLG